jgi:hypothetical protein
MWPGMSLHLPTWHSIHTTCTSTPSHHLNYRVDSIPLMKKASNSTSRDKAHLPTAYPNPPQPVPTHPAWPSEHESIADQAPIPQTPHTGRIHVPFTPMAIRSTPLTQHGPACVDHLQLTVAAEGLRVSGQTSSVPSIVWQGVGRQSGATGGEKNSQNGWSKSRAGMVCGPAGNNT